MNFEPRACGAWLFLKDEYGISESLFFGYTWLLLVILPIEDRRWKTVDKCAQFSTGLWKSLWIAVKSSKIKGFFHPLFHRNCGNPLSRGFGKKMHFLHFSQMIPYVPTFPHAAYGKKGRLAMCEPTFFL